MILWLLHTLWRRGTVLSAARKTLPILALALTLASPTTANCQIGSPILDDTFGHRLPGPTNCAVWWCGATYKIGRQRLAPTNSSDAVEIAAARNEYEPVQIVLRPETMLSNVTVSVTDFVRVGGSQGGTISTTNVEICVVEYVPVRQASDYGGFTGDFPDPLVPLTQPITLGSGTNYPFWLTVYVPKEIPAGWYESTVRFAADGVPLLNVPLRLRVFDFTLSDVTHTRTAYGVNIDATWHALNTLPEHRNVWDLYMENFRRHRVSPYAAHFYSPVKWSLSNGEFSFDFKDFDAAMSRYVDEFGFNGFNLMGHVSPPLPTVLNGHPAFSKEYCELLARLMQPILQHLREKGWMEAAYCYWADEPRPGFTPLPYVLSGMSALGDAAPGLKRLLTFNVYPDAEYDPQLDGKIDIWVPISYLIEHAYGSRYAKRQASGEELWTYVANGPLAPIPNNFIDRPAIHHRIRFWTGERYGLTGDLYWRTTAWWEATGWRNPWTNTMTGGGGGARNGDGTLLYPPVKEPPTQPLIAAPFNSLRWELTREALEDREYFWLLKQTLMQAEARLGPTHPAVKEGHAAREFAMGLVPSISVYNSDAANLYAARTRLAEAIEALDDGAPNFVRHPVSRAVSLGESVTLRAEALGWPPPAYQWRLNGLNLPVATNSSLILSNASPAHTGAYSVVASNTEGVATSAVAKISGYWSELPEILIQPQGTTRRADHPAILSVTAVSKNPISYQWFAESQPINGATNSFLMIKSPQRTPLGAYHVVLSNDAGTVASTVAHVIDPFFIGFLRQPTDQTRFVGESATWTVGITSAVPVTYTWLLNGSPISGTTTNNTFRIHNLVLERSPHRNGYWAMNEFSGHREDSVSSNHFIPYGDSIKSSTGIVAVAVTNAGGLSNGLSALNSGLLGYSGPFTVGGWVNIGTGTVTEADLLRKTDEFRLYYTGSTLNRFRFGLGNGTNYLQDNTFGYVQGTWRFVLAWYDGASAFIQQNDGPIYSQPVAAPFATDNPLSALKLYGNYGSAAADELFITRRILTPSERSYVYNKGIGRDFESVRTTLFSLNSSGDAGSYSVVICNAGGCVTSTPAMLVLDTNIYAPQILAQTVNQIRRVGEDVTFSVEVRSAVRATYTWLYNGTPIPHATNSSFSITDLVLEPPLTIGSYWSMDELDGMRIDSASSNHFAAPSANIMTSPGVIFGAVTNNSGFNQQLSTPASNLLDYPGLFTVGGWVNVGPGTSFEADLLHKAGEFRLYYTGTTINRFRFEVGSGVNFVQDNTAGYVPGSWRFLVAWYDGTNAFIQQNDGPIYSTPVPAPFITANPLTALKLYSGPGGGIAADELFMVRRVLTAAERTSLFNGGTGRAFNTGEVCFGCPKSGHAGWYSVIVSNVVGSVTSSPSALEILDRFSLIGNKTADGSGFVLNVPANISGALQVSTNLLDWVNLSGITPLPSATNILDETPPDTGSRFYRLQIDN